MFRELVETIQKLSQSQERVSIAIEGFGGAGKSTLAQNLQQALSNTEVVHIDDFILKDKVMQNWEHVFDRQRLKVQVLVPAKQGKTISYQKFLWNENVLSEPITLPRSQYLIVEGISSFHPDLESFYDLRVWVETSRDVATKRGEARDQGNENAYLWKLWSQHDLRYLEKFNPKGRADFIFPNDDFSQIHSNN